MTRNKQSSCHYENESARKQQLFEEGGNVNTYPDDGGPFNAMKLGNDSAAQVTAAFGYAKLNGDNNTTLGIFKRIESQNGESTSVIASSSAFGAVDYNGLREKYKSLIRQLPSKPAIEKLLVIYFHSINYQYYIIDEGIFRDHLADWNNLSFSTLNKGPLELSGDLQFFPALLFQVLSLSLQFAPLEHDHHLESLKYAAGMSYDDLANDYSESSVSIMALLGKRHTTFVAVQAGFLRTSFLKNSGLVPEAWHSLSQTIRDAQEIGLHKTSLSRPRRADQTPEDVLENLWLEQLKRRMWLLLSLWDIHMAIVLGRPTTIDSRDGKPAFPIDAPIPKNRIEVAPSPRGENDPPTPLSLLIWTCELCAPLWDIYNLEKEDPHQNNIIKVENMHFLINQINLHCPPYFRSHNPDTTFDNHPDCYWLKTARPAFQNNFAFTVMALHRPYIFTNPSSRSLALKAGLDILRSQRTYFNLLTATHYKMFTLVLNSFDAVVLVAAIYILHPNENREDLDDTLRHYQWAMERFSVMNERNFMATAALGVLKAIRVRLMKALGPILSPLKLSLSHTSPESSSSTSTANDFHATPASTRSFPTPHASISSVSTDSPSTQTTSNSHYTQPTIQNLTTPSPDLMSNSQRSASNPPDKSLNGASNFSTSAGRPLNSYIQTQANNKVVNTNTATGWPSFPGTPLLPRDFDFSSMAPLQPMHDLLYNDLSTIDPNVPLNSLNNSDPQNGLLDPQLAGIGGVSGTENGNGNDAYGLGGNEAMWQFEGDFSNDSFWGFMNTYNL